MPQADTNLTTGALRANLDNALCDDDALQRLRAHASLLSFVAIGAKHLGGECLWISLELLAEGFDSCVRDMEHRERVIRRIVQRR